VLRTAPGVRLTVLFSPEHGFRGTEDRPGFPMAKDSASGLPIYSLYGGSLPLRARVDSIDVLLIDLQDIGARYYTYIGTAVQVMRDATRAGKRVIILDRPDPVGGTAVQGNVRARAGDPEFRVLGGSCRWRCGTAWTLGELPAWPNDALAIGTDLVVVPAAGWNRAMLYDQTGLPWIKRLPICPTSRARCSIRVPVVRGDECVGGSWDSGRPSGSWGAVLDPDSVYGGSIRRRSSVEIEPTTFHPGRPDRLQVSRHCAARCAAQRA